MELDEETMNAVKTQVQMLAEASLELVPTFAKIYKKLYDSLIKEGFTEEQAMKIVCYYNANVGK